MVRVVGLAAVAGPAAVVVHPVAEAVAMADQALRPPVRLARLMDRTAATHPRRDILVVQTRLAAAPTAALAMA
jgi:hypothetical protein